MSVATPPSSQLADGRTPGLLERLLPAPWRTAQRWRLVSGLILFGFALTHFVNHAFGLVSLEAMEQVQDLRMLIWGPPAATIVLYAAFAVHIGAGLFKLATRGSLKMPVWEAVQITLGLVIPLLLIVHVVGARVLVEWYGLDGGYETIMRILWPGVAWEQSVLLVIVWLHSAIGIHHWLKLKPWYRSLAPWLLALAVLIPALSLAGWITMARVVDAQPEAVPLLNQTQLEAGTRFIALGTQGYWWLLGVVGLVIIGRRVMARARASITIGFLGGRTIRVAPGGTLLDIARSNGIPHAAVCGGRGRCTTCRVQVVRGLDALPVPDATEARALARINAPEGVRLACQIRPVAELVVRPLVPVAQAPTAIVGDRYRWGVERRITVMFADLRGFTSLSEKLYPYDAVFLLNRYFDVMAATIRDRGGVIDKFLGDGIMALFGVDGDMGSASRDAVYAARDMLQALERLNEELAGTLPHPLRMGIGLHHGPAVLGRVGASAVQGATALTALGDTVNIASRLESLNKEFGTILVVSDATLDVARLRLAEAEAHDASVRGRAKTVKVRALRDLAAFTPVPADEATGARAVS